MSIIKKKCRADTTLPIKCVTIELQEEEKNGNDVPVWIC